MPGLLPADAMIERMSQLSFLNMGQAYAQRKFCIFDVPDMRVKPMWLPRTNPGAVWNWIKSWEMTHVICREHDQNINKSGKDTKNGYASLQSRLFSMVDMIVYCTKLSDL